MASQILVDLTTAVANAKGAMDSATELIGGISARIQAAVDAALKNGATAEELAPVQAEIDALNVDAAELSAAVAANP